MLLIRRPEPGIGQAKLRADVGKLEEPRRAGRGVGEERQGFAGPKATANQFVDGIVVGIGRLWLHGQDSERICKRRPTDTQGLLLSEQGPPRLRRALLDQAVEDAF